MFRVKLFSFPIFTNLLNLAKPFLFLFLSPFLSEKEKEREPSLLKNGITTSFFTFILSTTQTHRFSFRKRMVPVSKQTFVKKRTVFSFWLMLKTGTISFQSKNLSLFRKEGLKVVCPVHGIRTIYHLQIRLHNKFSLLEQIQIPDCSHFCTLVFPADCLYFYIVTPRDLCSSEARTRC